MLTRDECARIVIELDEGGFEEAALSQAQEYCAEELLEPEFVEWLAATSNPARAG